MKPRVTAMADKLNIEFALIHRKRDGKALSAPEKMELLVGDVQDKVRHTPPFSLGAVLTPWVLGRDPRRRHD